MILKIFAVLDSKAAFFGNPWFDQKEGSATRNFADAVNDSVNPNNMWNKHPEDFSLYCIGGFDNETGELIPAHPRSLVTASALRSLNSSVEMNNEKQISDELRILSDPKGLKPA